MRRRRRVALLVLGGLLVAGGAVGVDLAVARPSPDRPTRRPLGVGLAACTFVERTPAPTFDYVTGTMSPTRTLVTDIRYPSRAAGPIGRRRARPARTRGGWPVVVFASGYRLDPSAYGPLLDAWVRSGLVVVAPVFPYTSPAAYAAAERRAPGIDPERDLAHEPADLAYVAGQVVAAATGGGGCRVLSGLVDPRALALAGQSDGGQAAGMLAYDRNDQVTSPPFRAVAVLSAGANGTDPYGGGPSYPPLLVVQSSNDTCSTPQEAAALYDEVDQRDKWFLEDHSRTHLGPYVGTEPRTGGVVAAVTTRFFGLELHGEAPGARFLRLGNAAPAVATLDHGLVAPAMPDQGSGGVACYAS